MVRMCISNWHILDFPQKTKLSRKRTTLSWSHIHFYFQNYSNFQDCAVCVYLALFCFIVPYDVLNNKLTFQICQILFMFWYGFMDVLIGGKRANLLMNFLKLAQWLNTILLIFDHFTGEYCCFSKNCFNPVGHKQNPKRYSLFVTIWYAPSKH